ncbi:MAG: hypothetical protein ACRCYX_08930 [Dermatophilaceae bacterium]
MDIVIPRRLGGPPESGNGGWVSGMLTQMFGVPVSSEPHVVTAWSRGSRGRRHLTGTTLHSPGGTLLGRAESVWLAIDPATFGATTSRMTNAAPATGPAADSVPGGGASVPTSHPRSPR